MATHSSILAWKMPWTEELEGLQSMMSQRVRHDLGTKHITHIRRGRLRNCDAWFKACFSVPWARLSSPFPAGGAQSET